MLLNLLVAVAVAVPLASFALMRLGSVRITERHHSRHDTYVVPVAFTRMTPTSSPSRSRARSCS